MCLLLIHEIIEDIALLDMLLYTVRHAAFYHATVNER